MPTLESSCQEGISSAAKTNTSILADASAPLQLPQESTLDAQELPHEGKQERGSTFMYSLLPRSLLDPCAWTEARKSETAPRSFWRCFEVATRWPQRFEGAEAVALWTDGATPTKWLKRWADLFMPCGSEAVELLCPANLKLHNKLNNLKVTGQSTHGVSGVTGASILLCDVGFGGDEVVEALKELLSLCTAKHALLLAQRGLVVLKLRCGKTSRSLKRWHRDMARNLEAKLGAHRIELLHLLGDRDQERTAIFEWDVDKVVSADQLHDHVPAQSDQQT